MTFGDWVLVDAGGGRVASPCCDSDWMEPRLLTALCGHCGKAHVVTDLGAVSGSRTVRILLAPNEPLPDRSANLTPTSPARPIVVFDTAAAFPRYACTFRGRDRLFLTRWGCRRYAARQGAVAVFAP